jgi:hypothetical protein
MNQASYDLARLSRNELITRAPHRNLYTLTPDGLRFAIFYTKVHDRLLRPLMASDQPQAPPALRDALHAIDQHVSAHHRGPAPSRHLTSQDTHLQTRRQSRNSRPASKS